MTNETLPVLARSILDEHLPVYDVVLTEHLVVEAEAATVYAVAHDFDFMTVRAPLITAMMTVRAWPSRLRGRAPEPLKQLRLASESDVLPGWLLLGQIPGQELAFGAVGRFWKADIDWLDVAAGDFAAFAEPGWGKIGCHLLVRADGPGRTVLTYECRTSTTDRTARTEMARYWWAIRPFVGYVLRAVLRTIARNSERPA